MRVAIYTICLDEGMHVERFMRSCAGADEVWIGDTGSTDGGPDRLRKLGARVIDLSVRPWRFDLARNALLFAITSDIDVCVSLDMDEVLEEGWRDRLDDAWTMGATRAWYDYRWSKDVIFRQNKVHSRHGYAWKYPCHEHLDWRGPGQEVTVDSAVSIVHLPDETKSRGSYLGLLALGARENPSCDRLAYYHARELFFREQWAGAEQEFTRYLNLPTSTWDEERSQALLYASRCMDELGDRAGAEAELMRAIAECPSRRETWAEAARTYSKWNRPDDARWAAGRGLAITDRRVSFLSDDRAWDGSLEELAT